MHKDEERDQWRGKNMTLSEVKPVENIRKNLQSFLEMSPLQKEVLLSHKLKDHACEYQNPFGLKEVSHRARISGEFDSSKDSQ